MTSIVYDTAAPAVGTAKRHAHWALRIALASVYLYHGLGKFPALEGMSAMLGLPVPVVLLVALGETAGGLLILAGGVLRDTWRDIATRLGAAMLIPIILGAIALVHWPQWSFVPSDTHPMGGMEFQVTLLLIQLYLLIKGKDA